jgi:hypothetical protein
MPTVPLTAGSINSVHMKLICHTGHKNRYTLRIIGMHVEWRSSVFDCVYALHSLVKSTLLQKKDELDHLASKKH